jgi:mannose-6-phosphate isomerase class I
MPFEIERFHFYTKAEHKTENKFAHIITLTIGSKAVIQSKQNQKYRCGIDLFQSAIIPASFGEYEIISEDGGFCEVVLMRWKTG